MDPNRNAHALRHPDHFLRQPLTVRGRQIPGRLFLAPLSKLGNTAFRELVAGYGGYGLLFSEMCWARSVPCGNGHDQGGFMWRSGENLQELVCQIFGNDPEAMARAAAIIEKEGFFGVDINFGCSVAAVCKKQCGAALLRVPDKAAAIVAAVREAVDIPVFVKFRTGWEDRPEAAVAMARRFEAAGADALTFHPRVAPDRRTRPPKWAYIADVKSAVDRSRCSATGMYLIGPTANGWCKPPGATAWRWDAWRWPNPGFSGSGPAPSHPPPISTAPVPKS
jgi:tRNA-dihydrouridine synthase B